MATKIKKYAEGGLGTVGSYDGTFGKSYAIENPYTYGMEGFKGINFGNSSPVQGQSTGLIQFTDPNKMDLSSQLSDSAKGYLAKKWGLWSGTENDTGQKGVADTLEDINRIISYKGGTPVTSAAQVDSSLAPLIAKRNKKGMGGILGAVAPIALSFLAPGIGTALGATLGIGSLAGTALAGAGLGALGSGISGGNIGLGALLGGAGGAFMGSGGLSGIAKMAGAGKVGASSIAQSLGSLASKVGTSNIGSLGNLSKLASLAGSLGGQEQQQSSSMNDAQVQQLLAKYLQNQQGANQGSVFFRAMGHADGGLIKGPGDGMSDSIPATINGTEPIRIADGEHIVPALQVSMLGRGSSDAGSKRVEELVQKEIKRLYGNKVNPVALQNKAMRKK